MSGQEDKTLRGALKYLKAATAGTLLASVGTVYSFDTVYADADEYDANKGSDAQVESLLKDHKVLAESPFTDVTVDYWASDAIQWGAQNGLIHGYADGTFRPHVKLTEGQFAAIMSRFFKDLDSVEADKSEYPFNIGHWSDESYVNMAKIEAPLMGYDNQFYRVRPVQRGVFAQSIAYVFGQNYELEDSIQFLFEKEITMGVKESGELLERYGHTQSLTRVQAMVFLHRMYNKGMDQLGTSALQKAGEVEKLEVKAEKGAEKVDGRSVEDRPDTKEDETRQRPEYVEPEEKEEAPRDEEMQGELIPKEEKEEEEVEKEKEEEKEEVNKGESQEDIEFRKKAEKVFEGYDVESEDGNLKVNAGKYPLLVVMDKEGEETSAMFNYGLMGDKKEKVYRFVASEMGISKELLEKNLNGVLKDNNYKYSVGNASYEFTGRHFLIFY